MSHPTTTTRAPSRALRRSVRTVGVVLTAATTAAAGLAGAGSASAAARSVGTVAAVHAAVVRTAAGHPSVARSAAVHAAAAGKLAPSGCQVTGTTAACDLWAMATTFPMNGSPIAAWGWSTSGAANTATAPGPVLVVPQGTAVTVTVHNALSQNVSLTLPGQTHVLAGGRAGDDVVGAAPGATTTYTFTADHAGTFAYEAGHTRDGARQVAMGLAGALVVTAPDGTAYGSAYDDEAVLALSEVDPALNADPLGFDMRKYDPKYRLINGKAFPQTDPVSTDQGHVVLLRYLNLGTQTHSMDLLGAGQTLLANDGHALRFAQAEVTEPVVPGASADTLVTMPTGPEAKITVYDAGLHLDNAHQNNGDPLQTAFGGMMTVLDTNAPPPSTDGVGPVSIHLTVSPNPSDGLAPVTVTADVTDALSQVSQAELVVDDAVTTGPGFGTPMTGTFGTPSVAVTGTISVATLAALPAGKHVVYVRGLDSAGNWGVIGSVVLNLPKTGPATTGGSVADAPANGASDVVLSATGDDTEAAGTITAAEYFVDAAGANGAGIAMTLNRSAAVVSEDAVLTAASVKLLGEGPHHLLVHSKDSLGLWGPVLDVPLYVDLTGPVVDGSSVSPNPSNGVLSDKANPGYLIVSAQVTDRDGLGGPGVVGALQSPVVAAEGFLDPKAVVPAGGTGFQMLPVDGAFNSSVEQVYGLIPVSQVRSLTSGVHHVGVRGKDAAGNWGAITLIDLVVDKVPPVLGALTASPTPAFAAPALAAGQRTTATGRALATSPMTTAVSGSPVTLTGTVTDPAYTALGMQINAAESWVGTTDPGPGKGTAGVVSVSPSGVVSVTVVAPSTSGTAQLNLRVQDKAGNWSNVSSVTVTVTRPTAIFSSTFDTGLGAWSSVTGPVVATAPGIGGGLGLSVTYGLPRTPAFVTDTTPAAETAYHATFLLDAGTLSAGTTPLTLFDASTGTGGQVLAVQLRRNGSAAQVRTVMSRTGAGALTGGWVNLAAGQHAIALDWRSGPATGSTAGQLVLKVDGVTVQTQTGSTSGLRVESVRLGVVAGVGATTTGTVRLDTFGSTR